MSTEPVICATKLSTVLIFAVKYQSLDVRTVGRTHTNLDPYSNKESTYTYTSTMGLRNSKPKRSYEVTPPQSENQSPPQTTSPTPTAVPQMKSDETHSPSPSPSPSTIPISSPSETTIPDGTSLVPNWLNETQFVNILAASVPHFSKILSFRARPAMSPGENYATLMLRISIDVELDDKSTKHKSFMMKVPHNTPQMEQMLAMANFFKLENMAYIDILPKLEELYRVKGMEVALAPRAHRLDPSQEPKLAYTVLMNDLGQDGFKNLNRLECLNLEQTKFVLRKMAQYHAATAMMIQVYGPYPDTLMNGIFGANKDAIKAFMDGMLGAFQITFMEHLKDLKDGEKYRDKLTKTFSQFVTEFVKLSEYDPSEFNVLSHGDCWTNNLLFKLDPNGEIEDMVFVDFQNPKYGSPVQDLFYFIITSVHIDYKLAYFDFFVKHYHDQLTKHLDLLGFTGRQPSLRELHMQFYKYGEWALYSSITVLPVVLLDPTEGATFENFMGGTEAAANFKNLLYSNPRYRSYIEQILPWLDNRGLLDVDQPIQNEDPLPLQPKSSNVILDWLTVDDFSDIIAATDPEFESIVSGCSELATKPGDNYASKLLKVDINVQLKDKSAKSYSYILKTQVAASDMINLADFNLFPKEIMVYDKYVPGFEALYRDAGLAVTFSPKSYRLSKPVTADTEYLILENLQARGFKMCDRMKGMDLEHSKCALKKLAQWHAASLQYKDLNGPYPALCHKGIFTEKTAEILKPMFAQNRDKFLDVVAKFDGADEYMHKLPSILDAHVAEVIKDSKFNEKEFNVLNHGDAWVNNIMFKYNADGQVEETYLLDHQVSQYGNPAQDLYYFIMSSTQLDIKVDQFDYLIRWYHQNLVEHAKLLKYSGFVPTLKELHFILIQHPIFAVGTVVSTLSICLNKADDNFTPEAIFGDNPESDVLRSELMSNERYRANVERIMPWLNRRGLLDFVVDSVETPGKTE
ncbi:uncharacterized protein [Drosophila pseudoobscura]|uniref:CHK kinase-like domain-containing protein n=1 Tax=Drosophila pseudoobscura pseudoobscura TaxID=46245 RepID=A0A6I8VNF6_DROPS|nr:uncharacterized protein LOC4802848 [Drosophila pseudoobscura]